jgi:hypothetical protein
LLGTKDYVVVVVVVVVYLKLHIPEEGFPSANGLALDETLIP